MWRLFQPLDYLRVRHPEKWVFDWILPLLVASGLTAAWFCGEFRFGILKPESGIIPQVQSLLSILTGFFIAALAAVSTFNNDGMDKPLAGKTPAYLKKKRDDGTTYEETLTRRRFLSLLFGFLALLALVLYALGVVAIAFHEELGAWLAGLLRDFPKIHKMVLLGAWAVYATLLSLLLINTLLGLFYLTERIHRPEGKHVVGKPTTDD